MKANSHFNSVDSIWRCVALLIAIVGIVVCSLARAEDRVGEAAGQIERAVRSVWITGGNYRPLCAALDVLNAEQQGVQEIEQSFAPGQWVIRLSRAPSRAKELAKLDHLAKFGFLERKDTFINVGPISARSAVEYRPTLAGWSQSIGRSGLPCFYYGMAQVLKIVHYSETEIAADGYSQLTINFLHGAVELEPWAAEAGEFFPAIRESLNGRRGTFTFYRSREGKLKVSRADNRYIDDAAVVDEPFTLPGIKAAQEGIERVQASPSPQQGLVLPEACLPLFSKNMSPLWVKGDEALARQAVLKVPAATGSAREAFVLAYMRLLRLQSAGLLSVVGNPDNDAELNVKASSIIEPLLVKHGACLPLGDVRTEVIGVQRDDVRGMRQRFKARYIVRTQASWIGKIRNKSLLSDLEIILRDGQPFEGTTLKMPYGWAAAYLEDRRPVFTHASLTAVGMAPSWRNTTEKNLPGASVINHELHVVGAYAAPKPRGAPTKPHPRGRIDVRVNKSERPVLVVLHGYEPIIWNFRIERGAKIDAVLALGYYEQRISNLPSGVPAVTAYSSDGQLRFDPSMTRLGSSDITQLIAKLGIEPTSIQNLEGAREVTVGTKTPKKPAT